MLKNVEAICLEDSIELYWDKPLQVPEGAKYVVNGDKSAEVDKTHAHITGLESGKEYSFTIAMVDKDDKIIEEPVSFKASTKPTSKRIDVTKAPYNCVGDGVTMNTAALQQAINDCQPGETVYIPAGVYMTGALDLHSDMTLFVDEGATLQGTSELEAYLPKIWSRFEGTELECYRSLLNLGKLDRNDGYNCKNVTICGGGTIMGGGVDLAKGTIRFERERLAAEIAALGDKIKEYEHVDTIPGRMRGRLINMSNCQHITICDLTLGDAASWNIHFIYSQDIRTCRCTIKSEGIWNGDGWDPDSSVDCTIFGCIFHTEDDSVAIKSGKNPEGNAVNRPTKNIKIFDCFSHFGHGLCIGSEMSGGVEGVHIWDCHMGDSLSGIEIKATKKRGGYVKDIHVDNVVVSHIMFHSVGYNDDGIGAEHPPVFENCQFTNMNIWGEYYSPQRERISCDVVELIGFDEPGYAIKNVTFDNCTFGKPGQEGKKQTITLALAEGINFTNVKCI